MQFRTGFAFDSCHVSNVPFARRSILARLQKEFTMATGRPQKGLNSNKNHHDSLSQSGSQRFGFGGSPSTLPKTTISSVLTPKSSTPKADAPRSLTNRSDSGTSNDKAPFKSF